MTDLQIIKKRIYAEGKIEYLLEQLECRNIKPEQDNKIITAGLPDKFTDSKNNRTVQVKNNEKLSSYVRSRGIEGDIFNIVAYIEGYNIDDIYNSKIIICNILNYPIEYKNYKPKKDWNEKLHRIIKKRLKFSDNINIEDEILPKTILNQYINLPVYEWLNEGLNYQTQREFEIGMDILNGYEKIIFPIYNEDNNLLTVKARFLHKYENLFRDMKYLYLYPYNRRNNLFNLNRAKLYSQDIIYVVEGEKTTMFAWQYGIKNCVAIQGDEINPIQIFKLLQLNCKIVFIFDKDMQLELFEKYKKQLKRRICYCIIDTDDLLGKFEYVDTETGELIKNKSSPTDKGKDMFLELINNKKYWIKL